MHGRTCASLLSTAVGWKGRGPWTDAQSVTPCHQPCPTSDHSGYRNSVSPNGFASPRGVEWITDQRYFSEYIMIHWGRGVAEERSSSTVFVLEFLLSLAGMKTRLSLVGISNRVCRLNMWACVRADGICFLLTKPFLDSFAVRGEKTLPHSTTGTRKTGDPRCTEVTLRTFEGNRSLQGDSKKKA